VLSVVAALVGPGPSGAAERPLVTVVPGRDLGTTPQRDDGTSAVGLVVPDAGPSTSEERAIASLRYGTVVNSLRGTPPGGTPLVDVVQFGDLLGSPRSPEVFVYVGIPLGATQPNDRRYRIDWRGRRGLLTSDSTRIPGLVSIADVGRGRLRVVPSDDPVAELVALDARIRDNGDSRPVAAAVIAVLIAALALVRPRAAVLAFATAAATNLVLGIAGISEPWLVVVLLALGTLAAVPIQRVLRTSTATGLALAAVIAAYAVTMAVATPAVALSPLGPTQNARFYGLSNLLETLLLLPALAAAALLHRRWRWLGFAAAAALALVTVAGSRFGADGGGALVLAAGFAVLAVALAGTTRRAVALALAAAVAAVAVLAADALVGPATHVGESIRGGPDELARDLWERLELSWARATDGAGIAVAIAAALAALTFLAARGSRRPLPLAVLAAVAVSLLVNDSPKEVAIGGLLAFLAAERWEARGGREEASGYTGIVPSRS
jgi:hypothetical protein